MGILNDELQCDVIVVGAGFAGLAAALEASKAGASVVVLGRRNPFASNSALGGGSFALVDTPLQGEKGIRDSAELFAEDILKANRYSIPRDVVTAVAQQSVQLYEWMIELGAQFYEVTLYPGHSVARVHLESGLDGANTLRLLLKGVMSKGADVRLGMVAEHLIINNSNEVEGVQAADSGGKTSIRAGRAIVLAAGGFGKNQSMMAKYLPQFAGMSCVSGAGSTGDGIKMGIEVGAELLNMDAVLLYSLGSAKRGLRILGISEAMTKGAILVNNSKRH
ncbi:Fumarate reductase flavoprotein subunit [subsurface metagenome]